MNRREAVAALKALPAVTRISRADLKPGEVLVVECAGEISQDAAAHIVAKLKQVWPDSKAVVMSGGMKIKIVEGAPA